MRVEQIKIEDVSGDELKSVAQFKYLGTTVTTDGRSTKEINKRIGEAASVVACLSKIWASTGIPLLLKSRLHKALDDESTLQRRMLVVEETRYQNAGGFSFQIPKKTHEKEKTPRFGKHGYWRKCSKRRKPPP